MKTFTVALILYGRVHQLLLNQTSIPVWPPLPDGTRPLLVRVPDGTQVGDFYNAETGEITRPSAEELERQAAIQEIQQQLEMIDVESGASPNVRDVCVATGFLIQTMQGLNEWILEELGIVMPEDFGKGAVTIPEIMALQPPENATEKEKKMFERFKTLKMFGRFQPEYNEGLMRIIMAEQKAIALRGQLAKLLESNTYQGAVSQT